MVVCYTDVILLGTDIDTGYDVVKVCLRVSDTRNDDAAEGPNSLVGGD